MIKFIFFGRLVKEKGVEMILDVFSKLHDEGITNWSLDIYGAGALENECTQLAKKLSDNVIFHGRGEHEHVMRLLKEKDFCLMPSLIIETFGLSALESLRAGTPVIGFQKGGTEPFISDSLAIEKQVGETLSQKLSTLIKKILTISTDKRSYLPDIDFSRYDTQTRMTHFQKTAGNQKRILLVSDFITKIGGIENYLHDAKALLEENGYEVALWGTNRKPSRRGLFKTACNISARRKLRKEIKKFQPDLIWTHSVMRELGRLPLTAIPRNTKTLMMFHDMGYFHPYPSSLTDVQRVPATSSLRERIHSGKSSNPLTILLLTLKWLSLRAIKTVFRHHHATYLVPSPFMKSFVETHREKEGQETIVLSHFVK